MRCTKVTPHLYLCQEFWKSKQLANGALPKTFCLIFDNCSTTNVIWSKIKSFLKWHLYAFIYLQQLWSWKFEYKVTNLGTKATKYVCCNAHIIISVIYQGLYYLNTYKRIRLILQNRWLLISTVWIVARPLVWIV